MAHETIPAVEPDVFTQGETLEWTKTLADFPASEWELKYYFRGAGPGFDVTAIADGSTHVVTVEAGNAVPSATTALCTVGRYFWEAWATNRSNANDKHLADEGRVEVRRSFLSVTTATVVDDRSQAEQDLAAVRLALMGNTDVMEYEIAGPGSSRRLRRFAKAELIDLEKHLIKRVAAERRQERRRRGGDYQRKIEVGFEQP